jgi:hypothetical protein
LNQITQEQKLNDPIIFHFYNNGVPPNVNYAIMSSKITNLYVHTQNAMEMEEFVLETNIDHNIILGKV